MAEERRFLIDRTELPYDAMVADPSWLIPIEEEEEDVSKTEVQTNEVHGEGFTLR